MLISLICGYIEQISSLSMVVLMSSIFCELKISATQCAYYKGQF